MTYTIRFTSIRLVVMLILGLFLVLGAHAHQWVKQDASALGSMAEHEQEAWPLRYTPANKQ